jgi:hypothetical protein
MSRRTRWVCYDAPLLVRVELDDERGTEQITRVVLATGAEDPDEFEGIELSRDGRGTPRVYDGDRGATMPRAVDPWARKAVHCAEHREEWPAAREWEYGPDPRTMPGLYDDARFDDDDEQPTQEFSWRPLR